MATTIPVSEIILLAAPMARDLVGLIIEAVQAAQGEDVSLEKIDNMLAQVEGKNAQIQALVGDIRRRREAEPDG